MRVTEDFLDSISSNQETDAEHDLEETSKDVDAEDEARDDGDGLEERQEWQERIPFAPENTWEDLRDDLSLKDQEYLMIRWLMSHLRSHQSLLRIHHSCYFCSHRHQPLHRHQNQVFRFCRWSQLLEIVLFCCQTVFPDFFGVCPDALRMSLKVSWWQCWWISSPHLLCHHLH